MCTEEEREFWINRNQDRLNEYEFYHEVFSDRLREFKNMFDRDNFPLKYKDQWIKAIERMEKIVRKLKIKIRVIRKKM